MNAGGFFGMGFDMAPMDGTGKMTPIFNAADIEALPKWDNRLPPDFRGFKVYRKDVDAGETTLFRTAAPWTGNLIVVPSPLIGPQLDTILVGGNDKDGGLGAKPKVVTCVDNPANKGHEKACPKDIGIRVDPKADRATAQELASGGANSAKGVFTKGAAKKSSVLEKSKTVFRTIAEGPRSLLEQTSSAATTKTLQTSPFPFGPCVYAGPTFMRLPGQPKNKKGFGKAVQGCTIEKLEKFISNLKGGEGFYRSAGKACTKIPAKLIKRTRIAWDKQQWTGRTYGVGNFTPFIKPHASQTHKTQNTAAHSTNFFLEL